MNTTLMTTKIASQLEGCIAHRANMRTGVAVDANMLVDLTLCLKAFAAVAALVWTGIRMCVLGTYVPIESTATSETRAALRALVRPLAGVDPMVFAESGASRKSFVALTAFKRLLTAVNTQMTSQMTLLSKGLGTYGAIVRLLTRMRADMPGQIGFAVCGVGAVVALKPLRVVAMLQPVVLS